MKNVVLASFCILLLGDFQAEANGVTTCEKTNIQVRLSVQDQLCKPISPPYNSSFFLSNVVQGSTLIDVMNQAIPLGFSYSAVEDPTLGAYITSVMGKEANSSLHQYWALIDGWTGSFLPLGASSYIPVDGDNILFKFSLF